MTRIIQIIFLLSFSSVFADEKADCSETAMTQTAMNKCAGSKNLEATETLEQLLSELVQILPEEPEKYLHKSQEAWSVVVDNDCEIQSWYLDGGSARPMIVAGCYAEHARQRIGLLLPLLCGPMVTTCDAREKYEKNL